jgi:outer membrane protein TolC
MKSPHGLLPVPVLVPVLVLVLVLGLAGCAAGPSYRTPKPDLPPQFASSTGAHVPATPPAAANVDLAVWWKALGDPELD